MSLDRAAMLVIAILLCIALVAAFGAGFLAGRSAHASAAADYRERSASLQTVNHPAVAVVESVVAARPAEQNHPAVVAAALVPPVVATPTSVHPAAPEQHASTPSRASHDGRGKRYVIVAGSFPIAEDAAVASANADNRLAELRAKGFRDARVEKIDIPGKGMFLRVVAMEAQYPSMNAAQRDVEAMKRRGDLSSAFAALAREGPPSHRNIR